MNTGPILIIAGLTVATAALGGDWDHRKAPAPLPPAQSLCIYAEGFQRKCIPIERKILDDWKIRPGRTVSPKTAVQMQQENEAFLKTKYR